MKTRLLLTTGIILAMAGSGVGQPIITNQPQNQTTAVGTSANFTVGASGTEPLAYQWQQALDLYNFADRPGETNSTFAITHVSLDDDGNYRVIITNLDGAVTSSVAQLFVVSPPSISVSGQPTNWPSVSLGASVANRISAGGRLLTYQWRLDGQPLPAQTRYSISLTNLQVTDEGTYDVVVTNIAGSITSTGRLLVLDRTFTKIMTNALVTEKAHWHCADWGDYDNDGYPDLFVHQVSPSPGDLLFRNNRDGTFTRNSLPFYTLGEGVWGCAWGDYDNDGHLDLFLANGEGQNVLFHNRGNATFERLLTGPGAGNYISTSGAWGDYDRDGFLDLLVINSRTGLNPGTNLLYRNLGDGTFTKLTPGATGDLLKGTAQWMLASWVDYDDDGWLDAFTTVWIGSKPYLYRNLGDGTFTRITNNVLVSTSLSSLAFAWADYDNDGRLDVFLGMDAAHPNALFHNEGGGAFKRMTAAEVGPVTTDSTAFGGVAWGDYDNDGFQDLFVAGGWQLTVGQYIIATNFLYHNNGDGTFSRIRLGSPANEVGNAMGAYWVDYDRDGFLDLFVQNHTEALCLYRNNGTTNNWIEVNCVGSSSPRFGTGAKVRAKATVNGQPMWQLRLIDAGGTCWGGQSFVAHFGLGDATNVDVLRIEWPSGIVQELTNVAAKQHLTVTEPMRLQTTQPGDLQIQCWKGMCCAIECSSDLLNWAPAASTTNLTGKLQWTDPAPNSQSRRFYRAVTTP